MIARPIQSGDLARDLGVEWLLTNGLGGFAMGTVPGVNTRRYHGLLVAAMHPPVGRVVVVHSVVAQLAIGDRVIDLSTQAFGDGPLLHPDGHRCLRSIAIEDHRAVEWVSAGDGWTAIERIELTPGRNRAVILFRVRSDRRAQLRLRPMTPLRDFHGLDRSASEPCAIRTCEGQRLELERGHVQAELPLENARWRIDPQWWHDFAYTDDCERGQDWREDVWSPGVAEADIAAGTELRVSITVVARGVNHPARSESVVASDDSIARRRRSSGAGVLGRLRSAADAFVVQRRHQDRLHASVIAGYPWFGDWGRDTMICLPGLMLACGRVEEAGSCLELFAAHIRDGLVPNHFDDYGGAAHYNTVDASLWFIHAVSEYIAAAGGPANAPHAPELICACRQIIDAYRDGTSFGIGMEWDGLITAGDATTQLTWMDAKRDGVAFTPRHGKAVEINALWHHVLHRMAELVEPSAHAEATGLRWLAQRVRAAFQMIFWWEERECCHDVVSSAGGSWIPDGRLRPNQIFAASLEHSPLTAAQRRSVVRVVGERLLTPFGLRTLDPADPSYRGRYEGNLFQRDSAYHQGTVWPWLIGPYCEAVMRAEDFSEVSKARAGRLLKALIGELDFPGPRGCLGQIAEVYDGDAPHRPSGCPAQAWSVAEILRIVVMLESPSR